VKAIALKEARSRLDKLFEEAQAGSPVLLVRGGEVAKLDAAETLAALDSAQQHGVRGGRVHDWLHARVARKAGAAELVPDKNDFAGLEDGFRCLAP